MPKVDYALAVGRDFSPVPAGIYDARLTKWDLVEKPGKAPYYNCEYTLTDHEGKKVWDILSLNPNSLWAFKQTMLTLGADAQDLEPGSDTDTDDIIASVLEASCRLALSVVDYTNNKNEPATRNEVDSVLAPDLPF